MRLIPFLTALLVTAVLYLLVMERQALMAFATTGEVPSLEEVLTPGSQAEIKVAETEEKPATDETAVRVLAMKSRAQVIDSAVILRGETRPERQVQVRAETSGQVISEPLRKGSFVQQGQLLCQIDAGTRDATLAEAKARLNEALARVPETEARLSQAQAQLHEAELNYTAAAKLSEGGYASETRVAATEAAVSSAKAAVESARSGLKSAQSGIQAAEAGVAAATKEIDRLTLTAPFAGLLESDTAEIGSLLQPGALCATVIQLDPIKVVGYVPETQVNRVAVGALAGARLSDDTEVRGRVTFLSRSADQTTRTFLVEIQVPNPALTIRDGQTAEILISADGAQAHLLPASSLTLNDDGALGVRLVGAGNRTEFAPVTLLRDTAQGVWIAGLPEEADVIIMGQEYVTEGVLLQPTFKEPQQ